MLRGSSLLGGAFRGALGSPFCRPPLLHRFPQAFAAFCRHAGFFLGSGGRTPAAPLCGCLSLTRFSYLAQCSEGSFDSFFLLL